MLNDERISNLESKFKSKNFWPPLWQKTRKLAKSSILPIFDSCLPKGGSNVLQFKLLYQIWNPLIIYHLLGPQLLSCSVTLLQSQCGRSRYCSISLKNGAGGHQMDQIIAITECSAKNQNSFFLMAYSTTATWVFEIYWILVS